jgi:hypothetical protein
MFYVFQVCYRSGSAKREKDNVLRERECLMHEVTTLRERLSGVLSVQEELERKNSAADLRCNELTQELEVCSKYQIWNVIIF